ncbi:hypothetical protein YQE_08909, partial [Dendroctonus ponderosae]
MHRGKTKRSSKASIFSPDNVKNFYSGIAEDIVGGIPDEQNGPGAYLTSIVPPLVPFCFSDLTFNEVRDAMDSLKAKNAQDIFGLNMKVIKTVKNVILIPLTKLINVCFKANVFPDVLKKAIVVPIHKKGSPNYPENYRPISLLLMISKIFKKCMALQLVRLFEGIELFSPRQFGFPQGKDAVMGILDHVTNPFLSSQ